MASVGVKIGSTHAKLHRRGHSTSSVASPPLPSTAEDYPTNPPNTRPSTYSDDFLDECARSPALGQNGKPLKIKPIIRKLTSEKAHKIDLSRTAAENERLAGLGIHEYTPAARSASDVTFAPVNGRSRHNRTMSNNSQFSTNSGVLQRPTAPYAHPMRQTPRPYTPPIVKSYTTSVLGGSEASDEAMDIMSDDEYHYRQRMFDHNKRSDSVGSVPAQPPLLHIHTSGSLTRLNNQSQSSLGTRSRGDTLRSMDSLGTPSSRTSLEKTVNFLRSGKQEDDPASRAASIRAARIAYNEKEEAKALRAEKEAMKQLERDIKKHNKPRRKSDPADKDARMRSNSGNEKQEFVTKAYNDFIPAHSRSLPAMVSTANSGGRTRAYTKSSHLSSRRSPKSSWQGFLAWFRTRLLRLGKRLHVSH
ncbi:hypothetical protein BLS_005035 [Venturia inaequalis]|uniref:Uncharacterized protein n=1 Tax=Venturia inaequalis TaxID=5025 RepID=A0A8H3UGG0_VENIN|nr:hypothetical protein BLS_005035 [Venturia inaequalis]